MLGPSPPRWPPPLSNATRQERSRSPRLRAGFLPCSSATRSERSSGAATALPPQPHPSRIWGGRARGSTLPSRSNRAPPPLTHPGKTEQSHPPSPPPPLTHPRWTELCSGLDSPGLTNRPPRGCGSWSGAVGRPRVRERGGDAAALVPERARNAPPARSPPRGRGGGPAQCHWPPGLRRPHAPGLPLPPRSHRGGRLFCLRGILIHCLLWPGFWEQFRGDGKGVIPASHLVPSKPHST